MARYKKHIIRYGETVQSIAALEMGDASSWTDLVKYNDLRYPYIVATAHGKEASPSHLVTIGDTLVIPIEVTLTSADLDNMSSQDKEEVSLLALGRDLSMTDFPSFYGNKGTHDGILQLNAKDGDLSMAKGFDNIKQVIIDHLLTPKGALILHPDYGSTLHELFGKGNEESVKLIDDEISRCILSDGRISDAKKESSTLYRDTYSSTWLITLESIEDQFEFVIERDSTGNFIIS